MQMKASDAALVGVTHAELTHSGWTTAGSTQATGQAHGPDGRLLRARDIARCLDDASDENDWLATVGELNGSFAVVSRRGADLRAAVDRLRSFPLFYTSANGGIRLSDRAASLIPQQSPPTLDASCTLEFRFTGYVTGEETLIPGLRQIRAGHALL